MKNLKQTYIQQRQDYAASIKAKMCLLLRWDEMQFAEYQYANGIAYLMWFLPCDEYAREQLLRSRLYWNWFKNIWTTNDAVMIEDPLFLAMDMSNRLKDYEWLHCPRALVQDRKPNAVVLQSIKKKYSI